MSDGCGPTAQPLRARGGASDSERLQREFGAWERRADKARPGLDLRRRRLPEALDEQPRAWLRHDLLYDDGGGDDASRLWDEGEHRHASYSSRAVSARSPSKNVQFKQQSAELVAARSAATAREKRLEELKAKTAEMFVKIDEVGAAMITDQQNHESSAAKREVMRQTIRSRDPAEVLNAQQRTADADRERQELEAQLQAAQRRFQPSLDAAEGKLRKKQEALAADQEKLRSAELVAHADAQGVKVQAEAELAEIAALESQEAALSEELQSIKKQRAADAEEGRLLRQAARWLSFCERALDRDDELSLEVAMQELAADAVFLEGEANLHGERARMAMEEAAQVQEACGDLRLLCTKLEAELKVLTAAA